MLQFIYLSNNKINQIEVNTFTGLISLNTLDLSQNALKMINPEILRLPHLENLLVAANFIDDSSLQNSAKLVVAAPLIRLDIAQNKLTNIPNIGILMQLNVLNVSRNNLSSFRIQHLTSFPELKDFDISNTSINPCLCKEIKSVLFQRRLKNLTVSRSCSTSGHDRSQYWVVILSISNQRFIFPLLFLVNFLNYTSIDEKADSHECTKLKTMKSENALNDRLAMSSIILIQVIFTFLVVLAIFLNCRKRVDRGVESFLLIDYSASNPTRQLQDKKGMDIVDT